MNSSCLSSVRHYQSQATATDHALCRIRAAHHFRLARLRQRAAARLSALAADVAKDGDLLAETGNCPVTRKDAHVPRRQRGAVIDADKLVVDEQRILIAAHDDYQEQAAVAFNRIAECRPLQIALATLSMLAQRPGLRGLVDAKADHIASGGIGA